VDIVNYTTGSSLFVGGAATNGVSNGIILLQSGRIPQSGSDTTGTNGLLFQHTISNATNVNGGYIYNGRETVFSSASAVNTFISFATTLANTNNEQMRITSSGNVGIGTPITIGLLTLGKAGGGQYISGRDNTTGYEIGYLQFNSGNITINSQGGASGNDNFIRLVTAGTEKMRITTSGTIGIGNDNPKTFAGTTLGALQVGTSWVGTFAASSTFGTILGNNVYFNTDWKRTLAQPVSFIQFNEDNFYFSNAATGSADSTFTPIARMAITSGGNVGIGTTNPQRKFVIADASGNGLEISNNSGYSTLLAYNRITSAYQNIVLTEGTGKVLIGTTVDNGAKLQVSGTATFTGQMQQGFNQLRSSTGTQGVSTTGDIFRFLSVTGTVNNGYYSAIFHIYVYDNNTGANSFSATYAVQTTSNGQTDSAFTQLASVVRGTNPVSSLNLISDGGGGAAKISMTTTATPTAGVTYHCSAIGIF
jgi:hypothetical protein